MARRLARQVDDLSAALSDMPLSAQDVWEDEISEWLADEDTGLEADPVEIRRIQKDWVRDWQKYVAKAERMLEIARAERDRQLREMDDLMSDYR